MDGEIIIMNKKKIIVVSLIVGILLLVPFNVVASSPSYLDSESLKADDSKLEKSEPVLKAPEYNDIKSFDVSQKELAGLNQRAADYAKYVFAIEDYIGQDLPKNDIPVFVEGVKVRSISIIDMDDLQTMSTAGGGLLLCIPYLLVAIFWLMCGMVNQALYALDGFFMCIGGSLGSVNTISTSIANGEPIEASQFVAMLEQSQTLGSCSCCQKTVSVR